MTLLMSSDVLKIIVGVAVVIILGIILYTAIVSFSPSARPSGSIPLSSVEVRSYEGEPLSSINDFRENSISGPQYINISEYRLTVTGLTNKTLNYSYDRVLNEYPHYSKVVTLFCVEGWEVTILWEGVRIEDLLEEAGPSPQANTVIFKSHDGYTTSLPLDYIRDRNIIIAYAMNGVTLPPERGYPFQLVAEDRWGYKWAKWVEEIELTDDPNYRGYWEQRGYSNTADINKSYFRD
jgi:DMSO/TMAO reductase YedYZ molybdopterin-dependent catalytic subunit